MTLAAVAAAAGQPLLAQAQAQAAPMGKVNVFGDNGARIQLDGQVVGQLPMAAPLDVAPGPHRLAVEIRGRITEAKVEVKPGRYLDVRFDRESGAVMMSQPPTAIVIESYQGLSDATRASLARAVTAAMEQERLVRFDPAAAPPETQRTAECLTQTACQAEFAAQNSLPYVLAVDVQKASGSSDWKVSGKLVDAAVGDVAASQEQPCPACTDEQAEARLAQLVRLVTAQGLARPRGQLDLSSEPAGAAVTLDGRAVGQTPVRRPVWAGSAEIVVKRSGFLPERRRTYLPEGSTTRVAVTLQKEPPRIEGPEPPPSVVEEPQIVMVRERDPRPIWRLAAGGATLGAGALFLGFGGAAMAIDKTCIVEPSPPAQRCDQLYDTKNLGTGLVAAGAVLSVAGIVLMAIPGRGHMVRKVVPPAGARAALVTGSP